MYKAATKIKKQMVKNIQICTSIRRHFKSGTVSLKNKKINFFETFSKICLISRFIFYRKRNENSIAKTKSFNERNKLGSKKFVEKMYTSILSLCSKFWEPGPGYFTLQGPPWLSVPSKLALTDGNVHSKFFLKVVLKSWDYAFFGTATQCYCALSIGPLDKSGL